VGFKRDNILTVSEKAVGTSVVFVGKIPDNACEGQMTFYNRGSTNLQITVKSMPPTATNYYVYLIAGAQYTEEAIIPGDVSALSDAAGGILSMNCSFSVKAGA
jgi:hypothetical protein